jgi:prolyl 4-hydroxylase
MTDASITLSAEVARADELDAAGNHSDALVQLVAGVRKQDVEALTRLGKRMLVGDRAPLLPKEATGFIADAARLGGAEAAAIQATLRVIHSADAEALRQALLDLALAAERGYTAAQDQLRVLNGLVPGAPEFLSARQDWRELAARFDVNAWHQAPAGRELHEQPRVCLFEDFAAPAICRWLIERARQRLGRAHVYDAVTRETTIHHTRTNSAALFNLLDTDCVLALVQYRIARCLNIGFRYLEPAAVLHYAVGEEIRPHFDFVDPNVPNYADEIAQRGQRVVTFLVYLNDDYGDGHTDFPRLETSHKGHTGEGLYFVNALPDGKADLRTLHAGRPPSSGEKWIVSQFVRNRPLF